MICFVLLKTKQQAQNGVAYAKPHVTKRKLNLKFWLFLQNNPKLGISLNQE